MNIFVPFKTIEENAICLDNLRLNKMVLESTQMLCTSLRRYGVMPPYKENHPNHPCTLWAGKTRTNFLYLLKLAMEMEKERLFRGMNPHKSVSVLNFCEDHASLVPEGELTMFKNCTKDFKHIDDVHLAYQYQLAKKWKEDKKPPVWFNRTPPCFMKRQYNESYVDSGHNDTR